MTDVEIIGLLKTYVNKTLVGGGALKGKNCTIDSIAPITGGNRITFKWTLDDGTVETGHLDVMNGLNGQDGEDGKDGKGIQSVSVNENNHLIITYSDGTTTDAGQIEIHSAVDSVNGKTGAVVLDAEDVGALPDDTPIPSKTSDLTNDSGFITKVVNDLVSYYLKSETYSKTEVDDIVTAIKNSRFEVVATLPTTDIKTNVIYLVPKSPSQTSNVKDEYINLDGTTAGWEKIGDTEIDLSDYVTTQALNTALADYTTTTDLTTLLAAKADKSTVDGILDGTNIDSFADVETALADKATQAEVNDIVNVLGAKNLLPFNLGHIKKVNGGGTWNGNVYTYRDITYTVNADGTITVNGTASADSIFRVLDNASLDFALDSARTYYYTGSPTTGSSASTYYSYYSELVGGTWTYFMSYGTSDTSITPNASATQIVVDIFVKSGQTINNQVFKPMIRLASDPDNTYEPYAMTNQQITPYVQAISNPNLLDNPWFTVNQRGQNSYGENTNSLDRWRSGNNNQVAISGNVVTLSPVDTSQGCVFYQIYEDGADELNGKIVTLSLLDSSGNLYTVSHAVEHKTTWTQLFWKSFNDSFSFGLTAQPLTDGKYRYSFDINIYATKTLTIKAVKLELGTVSTLAQDTAPNYATELIKCQRYYQRIWQKVTTDTLCIAVQRSNTLLRTVLPLAVPMRANPTVTVSGTVSDYTNSGLTMSKISGVVENGGIIGLNFNITKSGVTWSDGEARLITPDANDFYIDFSADL